MKPLQHQRAHRAAGRHGDDEHQEALVGPAAIALNEEEASRLLKALERPCNRAVARLEDLRRRS